MLGCRDWRDGKKGGAKAPPLPCWYHVWVIPVSRTRHWLQYVLVFHKPVQNGEHALPGVLDIVIVTPEIADVGNKSVVHLDGG